MGLRTSRTTVPSSYVFITSNITFSCLNIPRSLSKTAHQLLKLPDHQNMMTRKSVSTSMLPIQPSRNCIHRLITVNIIKGEIPPPPPDPSSQALAQTGKDAVYQYLHGPNAAWAYNRSWSHRPTASSSVRSPTPSTHYRCWCFGLTSP